MLVFVGYLFQE